MPGCCANNNDAMRSLVLLGVSGRLVEDSGPMSSLSRAREIFTDRLSYEFVIVTDWESFLWRKNANGYKNLPNKKERRRNSFLRCRKYHQQSRIVLLTRSIIICLFFYTFFASNNNLVWALNIFLHRQTLAIVNSPLNFTIIYKNIKFIT